MDTDTGRVLSDRAGHERSRDASPPSGDHPSREVAAVWRCGVADVIGWLDLTVVRPLQTSRKKAERELGERINRDMQAVFDASRLEQPIDYGEAFHAGKRITAALRARAAMEGK